MALFPLRSVRQEHPGAAGPYASASKELTGPSHGQSSAHGKTGTGSSRNMGMLHSRSPHTTTLEWEFFPNFLVTSSDCPFHVH